MYKVNKEIIRQSRIRERELKKMSKPNYTEDFLKRYEKTPLKNIKSLIKHIVSHRDEKVEIDLDELNSIELMELYYYALEKQQVDAHYSSLVTQINGRITITQK